MQLQRITPHSPGACQHISQHIPCNTRSSRRAQPVPAVRVADRTAECAALHVLSICVASAVGLQLVGAGPSHGAGLLQMSSPPEQDGKYLLLERGRIEQLLTREFQSRLKDLSNEEVMQLLEDVLSSRQISAPSLLAETQAAAASRPSASKPTEPNPIGSLLGLANRAATAVQQQLQLQPNQPQQPPDPQQPAQQPLGWLPWSMPGDNAAMPSGPLSSSGLAAKSDNDRRVPAVGDSEAQADPAKAVAAIPADVKVAQDSYASAGSRGSTALDAAGTSRLLASTDASPVAPSTTPAIASPTSASPSEAVSSSQAAEQRSSQPAKAAQPASPTSSSNATDAEPSSSPRPSPVLSKLASKKGLRVKRPPGTAGEPAAAAASPATASADADAASKPLQSRQQQQQQQQQQPPSAPTPGPAGAAPAAPSKAASSAAASSEVLDADDGNGEEDITTSLMSRLMRAGSSEGTSTSGRANDGSSSTDSGRRPRAQEREPAVVPMPFGLPDVELPTLPELPSLPSLPQLPNLDAGGILAPLAGAGEAAADWAYAVRMQAAGAIDGWDGLPEDLPTNAALAAALSGGGFLVYRLARSMFATAGKDASYKAALKTLAGGTEGEQEQEQTQQQPDAQAAPAAATAAAASADAVPAAAAATATSASDAPSQLPSGAAAGPVIAAAAAVPADDREQLASKVALKTSKHQKLLDNGPAPDSELLPVNELLAPRQMLRSVATAPWLPPQSSSTSSSSSSINGDGGGTVLWQRQEPEDTPTGNVLWARADDDAAAVVEPVLTPPIRTSASASPAAPPRYSRAASAPNAAPVARDASTREPARGAVSGYSQNGWQRPRVGSSLWSNEAAASMNSYEVSNGRQRPVGRPTPSGWQSGATRNNKEPGRAGLKRRANAEAAAAVKAQALLTGDPWGTDPYGSQQRSSSDLQLQQRLLLTSGGGGQPKGSRAFGGPLASVMSAGSPWDERGGGGQRMSKGSNAAAGLSE